MWRLPVKTKEGGGKDVFRGEHNFGEGENREGEDLVEQVKGRGGRLNYSDNREPILITGDPF